MRRREFLHSAAASLGGTALTTAALARDWSATNAKLYTFERNDAGNWKRANIESDVVIGNHQLPPSPL